MERPSSFLGGLSPDDFLARYWQKAPLRCPQALASYVAPLSADELAGLACEQDIESRIVAKQESVWRLQRGPFVEQDFAELPGRGWTLLLQDLDEHVPEVGELLGLLDFLPRWRIDDVMASFAVPGGSVGPHFDQYDVFLLQVSGTRRWQWTTRFDRRDKLPDSELNLLRHFEPQEEWELGPGDMLYLPPHVAHYGVATSNCVTFSLGCRAPSVADLLTHVVQDLVNELEDHQRYVDADLRRPTLPTRLDGDALARARALLSGQCSLSEPQLAKSFGRLVTEPKALFSLEPSELTDGEAELLLRSTERWSYAKGSRWLHREDQNELLLFANGDCWSLPPRARPLVLTLCAREPLTGPLLRTWLGDAAVQRPLLELVKAGLLEAVNADEAG